MRNIRGFRKWVYFGQQGQGHGKVSPPWARSKVDIPEWYNEFFEFYIFLAPAINLVLQRFLNFFRLESNHPKCQCVFPHVMSLMSLGGVRILSDPHIVYAKYSLYSISLCWFYFAHVLIAVTVSNHGKHVYIFITYIMRSVHTFQFRRSKYKSIYTHTCSVTIDNLCWWIDKR